MNKKEQFVKLLISKTNSDTIEWKLVSLNSNINFILNPKLVIRVFKHLQSNRTIYVVEKKYESYNTDFDEYFQKSRVELYVTSNEGLEFLIDENSVSIDLLEDLLEIISEKANDLDELMNLFED